MQYKPAKNTTPASGLEDLPDLFTSILRNIDEAVAVLNSCGAVVFQNLEFERILAEHDFLEVSHDGRIQYSPDVLAFDAKKETVLHRHIQNGTAFLIELCPVPHRNSQTCYRLLTVKDIGKPMRFNETRIKTIFNLTKAETEVLRLVLEGKSNAEIAKERHRSIDTVKSQIAALIRKTGTCNRITLIHAVRNMESTISLDSPMLPIHAAYSAPGRETGTSRF